LTEGARDLRGVGTRIEELLGQLRSAGDPGTAETAEEVVRLVVELYGAGLERTVELAGPDALERFVGDELVASLLVLHDLHPKDTRTRVVEALDQVRPYLGSHAGGVELLGISEEGVVRLRLEGSCDGCPSSTMTVKLAIERAIEEAAPEVAAVEVENLTSEREPQLLQIQPLRREWELVEGLDGLEAGRLTVVQVAGAEVVVARVGAELYAYRDRCPACRAGLAAGAVLEAEVLACGSCRERYSVKLAGRGIDRQELHLDPLPLLAGAGGVRLAVASGVSG
jgi:Fe-S cluster biogenesis protein NfuA